MVNMIKLVEAAVSGAGTPSVPAIIADHRFGVNPVESPWELYWVNPALLEQD